MSFDYMTSVMKRLSREVTREMLRLRERERGRQIILILQFSLIHTDTKSSTKPSPSRKINEK